MQTQTTSGDDRFDVEDVAAAIREGRSLRPAALYRIVVLDDQLHERHVDLSDPVPTGRQILQAAGSRPADEYSVYAILTSGEFEDLRLDETYDLRGRGAERFVIFQTDRAFKFTIDDRQLEWGKPSISGRVLKALAGVPPETYDVYLEVRGGGQDILIRDGDLIDLGKPGIERFITLIRDTTEGLLTLPWLTLQSVGRYPTCADQAHAFQGRSWQRWSRHNTAWRPGIDGLHTMLKRIEHALAEAK